ncbi:MAG: PAS domain-containing protein [Gemmatimonadaceae bacterium]|nr:PAS domain-containing protein [Gemmatimonadaceae bacterium]
MGLDFTRARYRRPSHTLDVAAAEVVLAVELLDLLDWHPDLVHSVTPDGRFLFANRAWLAALGYERADLPRLTLLDVAAPEDHPFVVNRIADALDGHALPSERAHLVRRDGTRLAVDGSTVMHFMDGLPIGTITIMRSAGPPARGALQGA